MAKKKDDDINENDDLNEGRSDDINEADDDFGLPDVDSSSESESESEYKEPEHTTEESGYTSEPTYSSTEDSEAYAATPETGTTHHETETYKYERESSNTGKIIIIILVLLAVGAGIWYFGFYRPGQQAAEQARIEQEQKEAEAERIAEEKRQQELEEQRRLEAQREADRLAAEEAAQPKTGTFEKLESRTGKYYVIVASSLDEDLATDYAKGLTEKGYNTKILAPTANNKFHRVAVAGFDSWSEAQQQADQLKGEYSDEVWVVKF